MSKTTHFFALLYIIFISTQCYAIDTFWIDKTPHGYFFQYHDGGTIEYENPKKEVILRGRSDFRWYFFKNHTIGYFSKNQSKPSFFISNELQNFIEVFESENEWEKKIQDLNLQPTFWVRWYSHTWSFNPIEDSADGLWIFFSLIVLGRVLVIAFIGFLISWYLKFKEIYVYWVKKLAILSLAILCIYIIANFLLCSFPQSI